MLKQTLQNMNKIDILTKRPQSNRNSIKKPQQLQSVNLFVLQSTHNQLHPPFTSKSSRRFRLTTKKTPSDVIKEGIIRSRQLQRMNSLKCITSQNIKLFVRLQQQKSNYKYTQSHRELSCAVLPLTKSHVTTANRRQKQHESSKFRIISRCSSAASTLKSRCASLRNILTPNNQASRQKNGQIISSRVVQQSVRQEKENVIGNRPESRKFNPQQEEQIIKKKIGLKIPIDKQIIVIKRHSIHQKQDNKTVQQQRGVLTEIKQNFKVIL